MAEPYEKEKLNRRKTIIEIIVIVVLVLFLILVVLSILGPVIGNVFSNDVGLL